MMRVSYSGDFSLALPGSNGEDHELANGQFVEIPDAVWGQVAKRATVAYMLRAGEITAERLPVEPVEQAAVEQAAVEQGVHGARSLLELYPALGDLELDWGQAVDEPKDEPVSVDHDRLANWRRTHWRRCAVAIEASTDLELLTTLRNAETRPGVLAKLEARVHELELEGEP